MVRPCDVSTWTGNPSINVGVKITTFTVSVCNFTTITRCWWSHVTNKAIFLSKCALTAIPKEQLSAYQYALTADPNLRLFRVVHMTPSLFASA